MEMSLVYKLLGCSLYSCCFIALPYVYNMFANLQNPC